jgi:hypothetical protein
VLDLLYLLLQLFTALPMTYQLLHCRGHAFNRPMVCLTTAVCSGLLVLLLDAAAAAASRLQ